MALRFTFDAHQPHQISAIRNVVDLFAGLPRTDAPTLVSSHNEVIANAPQAADFTLAWLEQNLHAVQQRHNAEHADAALPIAQLERDDGVLLEGVADDSYSCPHFTLEMETGTGKTYVYFRTMHELHQRYGLRKFIIVVPSVAILEGVKKTFEITRSHFVALYGVNNFSLSEYDGGSLGKLGSFAKSAFPVVLLITQQSFHHAKNNFYKPTEKLAGDWLPYQWIQNTRPVVILDEPQNLGSDRSRQSVRTLKPLFVLRYSATHRQQPNPVYRLTPVQAFRYGLVKQIEVVGVAELGALTTNLLRLEAVLRNPVRARVRLLRLDQGRTTEAVVTIKQGDTLGQHSQLAEHDSVVCAQIVAGRAGEAGRVEFTGGQSGGFILSTSDEIIGTRKDVWRAQIERTIELHFARQSELQPLGIKVLSLFFIDRVSNYIDAPGTIRVLFDECFDRLKQGYPVWRERSASAVRSGYFAKRKRQENGGQTARTVYLDDFKPEDEAAKAAFQLIMQKKETLLSFPDGQDADKDVAFLFAHSALREGWDNPNVFQICTLNQSTSSMKKRQEIGRGLRLCVDQNGNRHHGAHINVLSVIANQSYDSYVRNLQQDYADDGEAAPPPPSRPGDSHPPALGSGGRRLCQAPTNTIEIDSDALVSECAKRLAAAQFPDPVLTISHGRFVITESSQHTLHRLQATRLDATRNPQAVAVTKPQPVPDFIGRAADETRLTRATLVRIFEQVSPKSRAKLFRHPEGWANVFIAVVSQGVKDHIAARARAPER